MSEFIVGLTVAQLKELIVESVADALESPNVALDFSQLKERYGFSRESLASAARDGLPVHLGPKRRIMAFSRDVEAWIRSRKWQPRKAPVPGDGTDAWERANREAESALGLGGES